VETFDLIIRKHDQATYEWIVTVGAERIDGGIEPDITYCLRSAASALFLDDSGIEFAITYSGTAVGTYSAQRLNLDAPSVADQIMQMILGRD
jgi:hypothetical protein